MFPLLNRFLLHFDRFFFFKIKSEESKMSISWYITFVVVLAQRSIALEIFKMPLGHKLSLARARC